MRMGKDEGLRLAVVCVAIVVASYPAWTGSWIYDDWLMLDNDKMAHASDLLSAFTRSSADYLGENAATHVGAVTYRPLSMLSLIAVQAFAPDSPLLHHLVSLSLHLASVALLFFALRTAAGRTTATLAVVLFGLHPLGIEAYGWINGRSDALAGLGVALLGWALWGAECRRRLVFAGLGALVASLSKETALLAVLGLALASVLPSARDDTAARSRPRWAAAVACLAVAMGLIGRALVLADASKTMSTLGAMADPLRGLVRLMALALSSLLVPIPRTMRNLGYELAQPLGAAELVLLVAVAALVVWLLSTRRLRECVLVLTAAAMVAPCVLLRHAFWLGCDRYLYIPLLLLCFALGRTDLEVRLIALSSRLRMVLGTLSVLVLSAASFVTAQTYQDQSAHILAMIQMRPDDPTGYLVGARWLRARGNQAGAEQLISRVQRDSLPAPLASQLATQLGEMERTDEALQVVDDMERRFPDDPYAQLDVLAVRFDQARIPEAAAKAQTLRQRAPFCRAARAMLERHLAKPHRTEAQRAYVRAHFADYTCD